MRQKVLLPLLVVTSSFGCGGANHTIQFVGSWTYAQGSTVSVACPGQTPMTIALGGGMVRLSRLDDNSLQGSDPSGCILRYDVQGATATLLPNQSCSPPGGGGTQAFTTGSLTLSAEGHTIAVADSGSFTPNGTTTGCTATLAGQLTRD
jgi:hypothetical protein